MGGFFIGDSVAINVHQKGDLVRVAATFKNAAGTDTDPTTVSFRYTAPSGTVTTLVYGTDAALVKASVGNYYVDLDANEAGIWFHVFIGTGAVQQAQDGEFTVSPN